jgi:hypothetical protein
MARKNTRTSGCSFIISILLIGMVTVSCCSMGKIKAEPPAPKVKQLDTGVMRIYDFGAIRLHAYQTNDPLANESFLLETKHELVGIETPAFSKNLREYAEYIKSLHKPVKHLIMANHGTGAGLFKHSRIYTTAFIRARMREGRPIRGPLDNLAGILSYDCGCEFNRDIPTPTDIIYPGRNTIGGIDFILIETAEGFDLEIPAINSVFTHMVGSHVHNILESPWHIQDMQRRMTGYLAKDYGLILTSHESPEPIAAAAEKLRYLTKAKNLAEISKTRAEFIAAMKRSFPGYSGESYLEMSAGALLGG